jgi:hypothetical protein
MIHPPKQDESHKHARGNPRDSGLSRDALIAWQGMARLKVLNS